MSNQKTFVIACAVLAVDIKHIAEQLGLDITFKFLEGGLHDRPNLLKQKLQNAINEASEQKDCGRIVVGYGVCGRGIIGIQSTKVPLSIPKVHDCISLFLGGDGEYQRQFSKFPGTYYVSTGWREENTTPLSQQKKLVNYGEQKLNFDNLANQYGQKAAKETFNFLNSWRKNYQRAAFIDTGVKTSPKHEAYTREMAAENNWEYEKIHGDLGLIRKLLTTTQTTEEILVVPPEHTVNFDALKSSISAEPLWAVDNDAIKTPPITIIDDDSEQDGIEHKQKYSIGLGIDAGGTYTDVVIYDFEKHKVLEKHKALTTKWDFTIGIKEALGPLTKERLSKVQLVSLSTTLATNSIVEGQGQKVGLLLMPPKGFSSVDQITHSPKVIISGRLDIAGREVDAIDTEQIQRTVTEMARNQDVTAFAISGFAAATNPAHELAVKRIIQEETGLTVTCGHELSNDLNFVVRATTATLNARIISKLTCLLEDLSVTLGALSVTAPIVVVKGDGTLMSAAMARERPVETILSGPAASVAGARHLTGLEDALVIDMGGTTSDTALIENGLVNLHKSGALVGGYRTHVNALEIRTVGLGGDSIIRWKDGTFTIGPRRVAPISWMGTTYKNVGLAIEYLVNKTSRLTSTTAGLEFMVKTGSSSNLSLSSFEKSIVTLLAERPYSINELVEKTGVISEGALHLDRLESFNIVQRCGLTPTDILHLLKILDKWDVEAVEKYFDLFTHLSSFNSDVLIEKMFTMVSKGIAIEILKRQLDGDTTPDKLEDCPICQTILTNLFGNGNDQYKFHIDFKAPVIGIGAPINCFLPKAANMLGIKAVLPENSEVANAIGAITSDIVVKHKARIVPHNGSGFRVEGLSKVEIFKQFDEADDFSRKELVGFVRKQARIAGTSSRSVELTTEDHIPQIRDGHKIFMGRVIHAKLTGLPDCPFEELAYIN